MRRMVPERAKTTCGVALVAWLAAGLVAGWPAPLAAQEGRQGAAPQEEPPPDIVFEEEIRVRLVTIPIVAQDRQGRPVTDLRPDELEIREGLFRRYEVDFLTPFFEPGEERQDLPRVRLFLEIPGSPADVVETTRQDPRYLILFLDLENDYHLQRPQTMEALVRFLDEELDPAYRIAVMTYQGRLDLALPFTQRRQEVVSAVRRFYVDAAPRPQLTTDARIRQLLDRVDDCTRTYSDFDPEPDVRCLRALAVEYIEENRPRTRDLLDALEGVVRVAGGLRGHKAVLALSHGAPVDPGPELMEAVRAVFGRTDELTELQLSFGVGEDERSRMEALIQLAVENEVSLNFLDRMPAPSDFSARLAKPYQPGARPLFAAYQQAQADTGELAASTGGVFVASTRVEEGLRRVVDLMEGGYYVGFHLDDDEAMTARRLARLRVRSTRSGVTIQHRRAVQPRRSQVQTGTIRGEIAVGRPGRKALDGELGTFIPVQIRIEPRDLGYEIAGEVASATFTLHFIVRNEEGIQLADDYRFITHSYPREVWRAGDEEPVLLPAYVELPEGSYLLEAVVRNPLTGVEGQITRSVEVRRSREAAPAGASDTP